MAQFATILCTILQQMCRVQTIPHLKLKFCTFISNQYAFNPSLARVIDDGCCRSSQYNVISFTLTHLALFGVLRVLHAAAFFGS